MEENKMKWRTKLTASLFFSTTVSLYMTYAALQHNPMGEYCTYVSDPSSSADCTMNAGPLMGVFISWLVVSFLISLIGLTIFSWIKLRFRK
ncbi:hypothetical protein QCD60_27865 [Pokkaliibacter sp. MBI-7]|uniref:hypothetical protein n=1 Tax=Pokkaliibacter sp. MBI-7 TaxID=3040600 RepID=UPI00244B0028|nr:hypothetical protein [Pokkaliibacter sp. MBI-7]MDH2436354.1 hypothetical protein [Pokkaliibacter sp. MBI-7]